VNLFRRTLISTSILSTLFALGLVVHSYSAAGAQAPQSIVFEDVTSVYHMKNVGKDIYAFIAPEPKAPIVSGNSAALIGSDAVLVVDSGHFPALTQRMIADIKSKTAKPVRYLVNTHWHEDHNVGNSVYAGAFPGLAIISTPFTRDSMNEYIPKSLQIELTQYPNYLEIARKRLQTGKKSDGSPVTEVDKVFYTNMIDVITKHTPQLKESHFLGPNVTFADQLHVDLGGREVMIFWPGNANTAGDVVVYVPDQKLLITGDILVWPVPYATPSYIGSWVKVLDKLLAMDVSVIVPGHGPVMHDKTYMKTVRQLLADLNDQVRQGIAQGLSLEQVKKKVTMQSYKDELTQGMPERVYAWDNFFIPAVESAWNEQKGIPIDENPFPAPAKK
jgi:glyoxylase-like metal-dependent hydrolase (beta-lactamase superfamily II)